MLLGGGDASTVELREVVKDYERGRHQVRALDHVSVSFAAGEFTVLMGPSGAGKSTLLHLLGGLDHPSTGRVSVGGRDLAALDDEDLTAFRRTQVGFVFQAFNLLPTLSAWENVALPRLLDGVPLRRIRPAAEVLLEQVGLGDRAEHRPAELSGGEMQRVAIARALIADPMVLLADEPTGNLDSAAGARVLEVLRSFGTSERRTVVMVTHDAAAASVGDRTIEIIDGRVAADRTSTRESGSSQTPIGTRKRP